MIAEHPITRRTLLAGSFGALSGASRLSATDDFWNTRPDSDWTAEEVAQLTSASPWAVTTHVTMTPPAQPRPLESPDGGFRRRTPSSGPSPEVSMPTPVSSRRNSSAPVAFYGQVTVTWESAAPIRLARREPLGEEFNYRYALRITGLPAQTYMPETGNIPVVIRLLTGTTLETASKKHEQSNYVLRVPEKKSLIFAFVRQGFPINGSTGFVWFSMNLNEMTVRVRFDLHTMNFRNLTAV